MTSAYEEPRVFQPGALFRQHHYVIERFLGAGASGQVYAVRHRYTHEWFALKVSHLKDRRNVRKVVRSLVEARAVHGLRHPNIVKVVNLACEDDGMVWQLMELLEGTSVGAMLGSGATLSPLSLLYALDIAIEVAWGLQAAHEQQIIHRDLHPFNVFVTREGHVKVLDFSLAKVIPSGLQTTAGNRSMGTLGYMAPEYLKGQVVTPQLDVYALGVLLWQMMVGRNPFVTPGMDMMTAVQRHLESEPESLVTAAGLPAYFDEVIRGATAKDPAQRYPGMWALAQAMLRLREWLLADPEARVVHGYTSRERQCPIVQDTQGHAEYAALRSRPGVVTAPPIPSARIVVAPGVRQGGEVPRVVAKTVPMAAMGAGAGAGGGGPVTAERRSTPTVIETAATVERRSTPTVIGTGPLVPVGVVGREVDVGAPTVRGGARGRARGVWALLVVPVALLVAVSVWVLIGMSGGRAATPNGGVPTITGAGALGGPAPTSAPRAGR